MLSVLLKGCFFQCCYKGIAFSVAIKAAICLVLLRVGISFSVANVSLLLSVPPMSHHLQRSCHCSTGVEGRGGAGLQCGEDCGRNPSHG